MPKPKKPREQKKTTDVTLFHLRAFLFIFFFAVFFLFYPGLSLYTKLFSMHKAMFTAPKDTSGEYIVHAVPYVQPGSQQPFVTAQGVYVIDLETATPLLEKNPHMQLYPASTTKVMTVLTAYDVYGLDDVLKVKKVLTEGQVMDLVQDEKMTFENLLYGALVHSGNDAAYVIADNYPRGYDAFIQEMNAKAQALGMKDSHFTNAPGLDDVKQYTSAFDLSLAGRELLRNKTLAKIVSTKSITVSDIDYVHFHALYNVNRLLGEIPGVAGLKTGKTDLAGENLITLYKYKDKEYLLVLLKSEDRFTDTQTLVNWIQSSVRYQNIAQ